MIELIGFSAAGLGFLLLLVLWFRSGRTSRREQYGDARDPLADVLFKLPPRAFLESVFSPRDWEFVCTKSNPEVRRRFLRQRKQIALDWLGEVRRALGQIMAFHRRAVRRDARLHPATEFRLLWSFIVCRCVCDLLSVMVWMRGPHCSPGLAGFINAAAEEFSRVWASIRIGLDPLRWEAIKSAQSSNELGGRVQ